MKGKTGERRIARLGRWRTRLGKGVLQCIDPLPSATDTVVMATASVVTPSEAICCHTTTDSKCSYLCLSPRQPVLWRHPVTVCSHSITYPLPNRYNDARITRETSVQAILTPTVRISGDFWIKHYPSFALKKFETVG